MKKDSSPPPQDLRVLCQQAGSRAAGWPPRSGLAGTAAYVPPPDLARRGRLLKAALLAGVGVVALAVVAAQFEIESPAAGAPPVARAQLPQQIAASPSISPARVSAAEPVRWHGDQLWIDLDQAPLAEAALLLARATGTVLVGLESFRTPVAVSLHLRTSDVAAAWQQLLRGQPGFSIACSTAYCQVLFGAAGGPTAPAAQSRPTGADPARPGITADELLSQPDGSC